MRYGLVLLLVALVALFERGRAVPSLSVVRAALESRWAPLVFGCLFAATTWWVWGQVNPMDGLHDELAYLLQARLFRDGRWTAPGPPMPEFFAQAHVLNDPLVASKYPPGHSLLLAIGDLVGMPVLVAIALAALRGGMVFALARRYTNGAIALATGLLMMRGQSLYRAASFFSETTTGALLLIAWYALLRWREPAGQRRWMVLLALSLGWCAITRPFSAVLFAIPIAVVVLRDLMATHRWRDLVVGVAAGSAVVGILPLWSARTTGDWRLWPATVYTRDYMPYDRPHFGYDSTPPRKQPPPDLAYINASLDTVQRSHTIAALPRVAGERAVSLGRQTWWDPVPEAGLALIGLVAAPAATLIATVTAATLFVGYLAHPTWADWTIYYMEIEPVLEFLTACGLATLLAWLAREPQREWAWERAPRVAIAMVAAVLFSLPMLRREVHFDRAFHRQDSAYPREFRDAIATLPKPSLLFVRHAPWHQAHFSLVVNGPLFASAGTWIAYDRGDAANAKLLRLVPNRTALLYDESRHTINVYSPVASR